ncbi:hypothetical protein ACFL96_19155, partial [Thermoproteota archaeon]
TNEEFVAGLNMDEERAVGMNGIFYVDKEGEPGDYVRGAADFDEEEVGMCLADNKIPVVSCFGIDCARNPYNVNADSAFFCLTSILEPMKTTTTCLYRCKIIRFPESF